jgi:hypothetical protein
LPLETFDGDLFHELLQEQNALLQELDDLLQKQTALSQLHNVLFLEASTRLQVQKSVSLLQSSLLLPQDDGSLLVGEREDGETFEAPPPSALSAVRVRNFLLTFFVSPSLLARGKE